MTIDIPTIFVPSQGIELVFQLNSLNPNSRASIIYDADYSAQTLTIAQPIVPVNRSTDVSDMYVTTLAILADKKQRFGMKCLPEQMIPDYILAGMEPVQALVLRYYPPALETNIRSAYRIPLSRHHSIQTELSWENSLFLSDSDFVIHDISITGMGIVFPHARQGTLHPLTRIPLHHPVPARMTLIRTNDRTQAPISFQTEIFVVRRQNDSASTGGHFMGMQFVSLSRSIEDDLGTFIHQAQMIELQRLSGLGRS
ncbi:MAG: PilZ domain-containing protein [Pseudomonadota bacterium]